MNATQWNLWCDELGLAFHELDVAVQHIKDAHLERLAGNAPVHSTRPERSACVCDGDVLQWAWPFCAENTGVEIAD